jgi:hypothetical protein
MTLQIDKPIWGPLPATNLGVGEICLFCNQPMQAGDIPALVGDVPADEEEREKMLAGKAYNAVADMVHWRCLVEKQMKEIM